MMTTTPISEAQYSHVDQSDQGEDITDSIVPIEDIPDDISEGKWEAFTHENYTVPRFFFEEVEVDVQVEEVPLVVQQPPQLGIHIFPLFWRPGLISLSMGAIYISNRLVDRLTKIKQGQEEEFSGEGFCDTIGFIALLGLGIVGILQSCRAGDDHRIGVIELPNGDVEDLNG